MKKFITLAIAFLTTVLSFGQVVYYSARINGGYTFNGFSPGVNTGSFTQSVPVNVPIQSSEVKTFLIASRVGPCAPITITLQGQPWTFNTANQVVGAAYNTTYGGASGVHAIDISGFYNININNFVFNIPDQGGSSSNRWTSFVIYRSFLKGGVGTMNCRIEFNTFNQQVSILPTWQVNVTFPLQAIDNTKPVALGFLTDYICDCNTNNATGNSPAGDGERVRVNGTLLGTAGTPSTGFGLCGGPLGGHRYYGNTLTNFTPWLNNNNNNAINCNDVLTNIQTNVANNALTFGVQCSTAVSGNTSNVMWGLIAGWHDNGIPPAYECECGNFGATDITSTSMVLQWGCQGQGGASTFIEDVYFRQLGNPVWTVVTVDMNNLAACASQNCTTTSLDETGLTPNTLYEAMFINIDVDGAICTPSQVIVLQTAP